jgi:hypothetical protein
MDLVVLRVVHKLYFKINFISQRKMDLPNTCDSVSVTGIVLNRYCSEFVKYLHNLLYRGKICSSLKRFLKMVAFVLRLLYF